MNDLPANENDPLTLINIPPPPTIDNLPTDISSGINNKRPTAATVIGIVLLVFAIFASFSLLSERREIYQLANRSSNLTYTIYPHWYPLTILIYSIIKVIIEFVLGINLLRIIHWARKATIIWLIISATIGILSEIYVVITTTAYKLASNMSGVSGSIMQTAVTVGIIIGIVLIIATNGIMIYFLTRPNVVVAYNKE